MGLGQHHDRSGLRYKALNRIQDASVLVARQLLAIAMVETGNMGTSPERTAAVESQIIELFRKVAAGLPSGTASLTIDSLPALAHHATRVELAPARSGAAKIVAVVVKRGVVYLTLGRATPSEFQASADGFLDPPHMREIEGLCRAVIEGCFEEDLWALGPEVFKCTGKITVRGRTRTVHYRGSFHPFARTERQHIRYAPYSK